MYSFINNITWTLGYCVVIRFNTLIKECAIPQYWNNKVLTLDNDTEMQDRFVLFFNVAYSQLNFQLKKHKPVSGELSGTQSPEDPGQLSALPGW